MPADIVKLELTTHKAVAAAISTIVTVAAFLVAAGMLNGDTLRWTQAALGVLATLGITGAVYQTPNKVKAVVAAPTAPDAAEVDLDDVATDEHVVDLDNDATLDDEAEHIDATEVDPAHAAKLAGRPSPA